MDIGQWDTVSTISVDYVNQQLTANLGSILQTFDYQGTDPFAGDYTISGSFGPWQVVPGGSDQLIDMAVPITSGSLATTAGTTDISGMTVTVQVSLQLLPATAASGNVLTFDFSAVGTSSGSDPVPGLVVPISCTDPNDTGKGSVVMAGVAACLVANASSVTFIFASIGVITGASQSWLTPVASAYQYQQTSTTTGYFGILSVVTSQDITGYNTQIDPGLTDSQYGTSFAISQALFLQNVVLPTLPSAFPGTYGDTFAYNSTSGTLYNTVSFYAPSVEVGLLSYTPVINTLSVTVESSILQVAVSGVCDLRLPNASISFSVTANNTVGFSNGALQYIADPSPTTSFTKDIPWYDYLLIGVAGLIAEAIFAAVIAAITNELGAALTASEVGASLTSSPPVSVLWPGMTNWSVQNGGLSTALYLQGQPGNS